MTNRDGATAPSHRFRSLTIAALVAALIWGLAGCGGTSSKKSAGSAGKATTSSRPVKEVSPAGDIPDNQAYVAYAPAGKGYSVKVPEGWARATTGGATVFTDKLNSIRIEPTTRAQAPTPATVTGVDLPKLAKTSPHFTPGKASTIRRTAGTAVLVTYKTDGPPDAVTGKVRQLAVERYEFWRNGRSVVLTLSGAVGADNVDPWKIVTNSFHWQP
jgi:hypothetical protein